MAQVSTLKKLGGVRHGQIIPTTRSLLWVDAVEKVENRTTPKISQMVIFGLLRRCDAL
jgi:hypothetical protein